MVTLEARLADLELQVGELEGQVANLQVALRTARTIGIAVGIVMADRKVSSEVAFEILKVASHESQRKLRDVAEDVELTGAVPECGRGTPTRLTAPTGAAIAGTATGRQE